MIKNLLVSIDFEVQDCFNKYYKDWDSFIKEVEEIIGYYKENIYKVGKVVINKKIGNATKNIDLNNNDTEFLDKYSFNGFLDKLKLSLINYENQIEKKELYNQLASIIIGELIVLFKISQINECKNLNIKNVKILADEVYSCETCKSISNFIYNVDEINLKNIHPYCKLTILPISNNQTNINTSIAKFINVPHVFVEIIKQVTSKVAIHLKQHITFKEFIFTENLNKILIDKDKVNIPIEFIDKINIDTLIVKEVLKDKLLETDLTWWENNYNIKKNKKIAGDKCIIYSDPFINSLASNNYKEYFLQSFIAYVLKPTELLSTDENAYKQLNKVLGKEFIRG